jgi:flagellar motor switch protein FliG
MPADAVDDKIAVLLNLLGDGVAEQVLRRLRPERAAELRQRLNSIRSTPVSRRRKEDAVAEFDRFYRFVTQTAPPALRIVGGFDADDEEARAADRTFEPGDDPFADLERLTPVRLAVALTTEHPKLAAIVLSHLPAERGAEVLDALPEEHRRLVFVQLSRADKASPEIVARIVRAVVDKALQVELESPDEVDRIQMAVAVLRSVDRPRRGPLLQAVEATDRETAARLLERLYVFDDLLKLENRTLQRLMGEVDSQTLATALCGADEELIERVMSNLAKRARDALREELEFQKNAPQQVIDEMRKQVVQILARLEQEDAG